MLDERGAEGPAGGGSSALHAAILNSAAYAIIATTTEGVITHFNRAAELMLGYSAEEVVGKATPVLLHDEEEVAVRAAAFAAEIGEPVEVGFDVFTVKSQRGLPNEHLWTYRRRDGSRTTVLLNVTPIADACGRIEGYLGVASDVSARLAAEAALRSSEEKLRNLFLLSPLGIALADMDGRFIEFNEAFQEITGYAAEELRQIGYWDLTPRKYADAEAEQLRQLAESGRYGPYEKEYIRKDGALTPLRLNGTLVTGDDGRTYIWSIVEDISERKRQEALLHGAMRRAEAANRAKSEFLANVSHELRTPLNGVIGLAGALARSELSPPQREMAEVIRKSGEALERLVSELLDVAKIEAGRLELECAPFDLAEEVTVAAELMRGRAEDKGLRLTVELAPGAHGWFLGDGMRLRQIVSNLLSNAIKFTGEGEIALKLAVREGQGGAAQVTLTVRDTGIGVPPELLPRLFEPFTQADQSITRRFGGTGLGLSICRDLAELMGGRIEVASAPSEGSTFVVELALSRCAEPVPAGAPAEAAGLEAGRPCRVLLVEDHPVNRRVVELILAAQPVELSVAADGAEGVAAFRAGAFDAVLMDMQMPVMDGLTATREIRRLEAEAGRPRTPIIMLTANALPIHRDQAAEAGADGFLAKPITPEALFGCLETALTASA